MSSWWPESAAPLTVVTVARHQVQEAAVHAWDAQSADGKPEPIPAAAAVDAVPVRVRPQPQPALVGRPVVEPVRQSRAGEPL